MHTKNKMGHIIQHPPALRLAAFFFPEVAFVLAIEASWSALNFTIIVTHTYTIVH